MKTRIKVIEYNNGCKEFVCQEFDWYRFANYVFFPISMIVRRFASLWIPLKVIDGSGNDFTPSPFKTIEEAKNFIDTYYKIKLEEEKKMIERIKNEKRINFLSKKKKTTYIKYP